MAPVRFDVTWRWLDHEPNVSHECKGLDPRTLVARIRRAIRNNGPVVIERMDIQRKGTR